MIISVLYGCDNCGDKKTGGAELLPEGWKWLPIKGFLCPTCARITSQSINNLDKRKLRKMFSNLDRIKGAL